MGEGDAELDDSANVEGDPDRALSAVPKTKRQRRRAREERSRVRRILEKRTGPNEACAFWTHPTLGRLPEVNEESILDAGASGRITGHLGQEMRLDGRLPPAAPRLAGRRRLVFIHEGIPSLDLMGIHLSHKS